ncbi:pheromone A receptor-domain-containing protein [Phakopsora pachyrhizi]|nr:pheromone A receptor-domain-containing protein [Phakopsora pachyrhizi]
MIMLSSAFRAYRILSLICALINIAPTVSHLSQGHSGPAAFGLWVVILNLLGFIHGLLWQDDALDKAPIFCDISAKIGLIGPLGLLMANCCIIRYLAQIVTPSNSIETSYEARKRMYKDYAMAFGFPVVIAIASVVFQVARYEVEILVGCSNVSVLGWPTLIILIVWSPIICGISCGYALYVLYWLVQQHKNLRQLVAKSSTPLNMSRFVRMCALAATYLCISAPYTIAGTVTTLYDIGPFIPWKSWSYIHNDDNQLSNVRNNPVYRLNVRDWLSITAGLTVFFFFSFAKESLDVYRKVGKALSLKSFLQRFSGSLTVIWPFNRLINNFSENKEPENKYCVQKELFTFNPSKTEINYHDQVILPLSASRSRVEKKMQTSYNY